MKITAEHVEECAPIWAAEAGEAWTGIVSALGIHYPSAAALLDPTISEGELQEWVEGDAEAQQAADDLVSLGLLERRATGLGYTPTLSALQALAGGKSAGGNTSGNDVAGDGIAELVRQGESHLLEFKETSRINLRTGRKDSVVEDAVTKTVAAFLNSDGGKLLVGIADDGTVKGLDPDLGIFDSSYDRFERWIRGDLLAKRIDQHLVTDNVATDFIRFRGKVILQISVRRASVPAWVDDRKLYRRQGNQTVELSSGRDIQQFLGERA